jgi:hypothetical protein
LNLRLIEITELRLQFILSAICANAMSVLRRNTILCTSCSENTHRGRTIPGPFNWCENSNVGTVPSHP